MALTAFTSTPHHHHTTLTENKTLMLNFERFAITSQLPLHDSQSSLPPQPEPQSPSSVSEAAVEGLGVSFYHCPTAIEQQQIQQQQIQQQQIQQLWKAASPHTSLFNTYNKTSHLSTHPKSHSKAYLENNDKSKYKRNYKRMSVHLQSSLSVPSSAMLKKNSPETPLHSQSDSTHTHHERTRRKKTHSLPPTTSISSRIPRATVDVFRPVNTHRPTSRPFYRSRTPADDCLQWTATYGSSIPFYDPALLTTTAIAHGTDDTPEEEEEEEEEEEKQSIADKDPPSHPIKGKEKETDPRGASEKERLARDLSMNNAQQKQRHSSHQQSTQYGNGEIIVEEQKTLPIILHPPNNYFEHWKEKAEKPPSMSLLKHKARATDQLTQTADNGKRERREEPAVNGVNGVNGEMTSGQQGLYREESRKRNGVGTGVNTGVGTGVNTGVNTGIGTENMNGTATPTENTNGNITSNTTHEHHANNTHNYHNSTNTPPLTTKRYKEKQKETQHHQYFKIEEPQPTPNITHQRQPIPSTSARQHSKEEEDGNEEEEYDDEYDDEEEDDDEQNIFLSSHSNNPFHFASHVDTEEAMEHLIQCIENIAPKHEWRHIRSLNLSHQNLTSVVDLADLFPCLEELDISNNAITEISRLPDTLQVFKVKKNRLTDIQGFSSLPNIQYIDLCDNAIDTFEGFGPCLHLRILHAENNKLYSCKPFRMINSLTTLNLRSNVIKHLRFGDTEMYELESLDLSYNRLESLDSIEGLHNLRILNLDHNEIESVTLQMPMAHLKILRLNFNRLSTFDSTMFPDLRTLYLDTNQIGRIVGFSCIPRLINFSLRDQGGQKVDFNIRHLRGVRKAYLSGNMFKNIYLMHDFFTLEYLELCAASINELPDNFASLMPNLVVLYLSNNFLDSIRPLRKLRYLRKLVLIGNKITNLSDTIHDISSISHLSFLDLRENPISRRLYPPLKLTVTKPKTQKKLTRYLAPEHDATWPERDAIFYNNLAEHWKLRRDTYRASFIKLRPTLEVLDHCSVTREEKETAEFNVSQIRDKSGGPLRERTAAEQESRENDTLS